MHKPAAIYLLIVCTLFGCGDKDVYQHNQDGLVLSSTNSGAHSTTAGNLMASAIKEVNQLDFVVYPTDFIDKEKSAQLNRDSEVSKKEISALFPKEGQKDQFYLGTIKGSDFKTFLFQRTIERYNVELEVAGARYYFKFDGGYPIYESVVKEDGSTINEDEYYKIAFSSYFFNSGEVFPKYKYRNSMTRLVKFNEHEISAQESLQKYLSSSKYPQVNLTLKRAVVEHTPAVELGKKSIHDIQGITHLSSMRGDIVETEGIVTAIIPNDWYPGGVEYIIQNPLNKEDQNPKTSEAIIVYLQQSLGDVIAGGHKEVEVADHIRVRGIVYEKYTKQGLTRTELRNIKRVEVIAKKQVLPASVSLGETGQRKIPLKYISTYNGDLNFKPALKLTDGIDFWESLEGMRVKIYNPRVVGFRGGMESSNPFDYKSYLTLNLLPDGLNEVHSLTPGGGILPRSAKHEFNPSIMTISSGVHTKGLNADTSIFNVGDVLEGEMEGILTFNQNLFGDGEYNLILPNHVPVSLEQGAKKNTEIMPMLSRPRSNLDSQGSDLTIAAYNVKNLSANEDKRIIQTGVMIEENLNCPDILGLIEIQDNNGLDFANNSKSEITLQMIIDAIPCDGKDYQPVNIDPLMHKEGGVPGANIRTALIYDANKLKFKRREASGPMVENTVTKSGDLKFNPGRVFPNNKAFNRSRRSLIVQFEYKNNPIFVVVNHFNSKLGDTSHWSSMQPVTLGSEKKRSQMAAQINKFVRHIEARNPKAHVAVIGDFNAFSDEIAMKVLEGDQLTNLMTFRNMVSPNNRYTTNHNGNSQSLDYIFVNKNFLKRRPMFEPLHLNSDYMGRLSDHDPVLSGFSFE